MHRQRFYILFVMLSCALLAHAVNVVFRLDDPTVRYDSVHSRIIQLFIEKQVPLSVAIIPCNSCEKPYEPDDSVYLSMLKSPNIEVCLHGFMHTRNDIYGEFGELSGSETERRIKFGKRILEQYIEKDIVTFIPPFNVINDSIDNILYNNGFRVLSAEMNEQISRNTKLNYYPETLCPDMGQDDIWTFAKQCIFQCKEKDAICVIMFHSYDLPNERAWSRLVDLLDECLENDAVTLYSFKSLYEDGVVSDGERYRANMLSSGLKKRVMSKGVFHTTWICYMVHLINAFIYALIAIAIGLVIILRSKSNIRKILICTTIVLAIISFCAAWWHLLTPLKLLLLVIMVGIIPLIMAVMKCKDGK